MEANMRSTSASQRLWLPRLITCLLFTTWAVSPIAAQAIECFNPRPQVPKKGIDTFVYPNRTLTGTQDPWDALKRPPPPSGTFPCTKLGNCDLPAVLKDAHACALLVIQGGRFVHEYYESANDNCHELGEPIDPNGPNKAYGIASITKSVVSTVLGHLWSQPERYGRIDLSARVSTYVPGLPPATHLHDGVTLEQALTMRSRLAFDNRDDHNCLQPWTVDFAKYKKVSKTTKEAVSAYAERKSWSLPFHPFNYSAVDTSLLGLTVESVSRTASGPAHMNEILSELIWKRAGMRNKARWKADEEGTPAAFCCFYATAHDMGRFGQYVLDNSTKPPATRLPRRSASGCARLQPNRSGARMPPAWC